MYRIARRLGYAQELLPMNDQPPAHEALDLLSYIADDVTLLQALDLPPLAQLALARLRERIQRLDVFVTAQVIEEAQHG